MTRKRHPKPCWSDMGQALKLLLGLADEIVQLIKAIHGG